MKIKVSYPSGHVLHLSGEWKGTASLEGTSSVILIFIDTDCTVPGGWLLTRGSAFIGDPRGIYQEEKTGLVLYNPRENIEGMDQWAVDWLNEHLEWPEILELT